MPGPIGELPDGFHTVSGKRAPTGGKWHIQLRCGFVDERIAYEPRQLVWLHGDHAGDIIAVKRAD